MEGPVGATTTVTFDDLAPTNRPLNGQYPSGTIDWGSSTWYLSGPWGRFNTNSVSFNGSSATSATFTFVSPRQLLRVDAYNGGSTSSTVTLSCNGQPNVTTTLAPGGQIATIQTNWTAPCTSVTISSSNGWFTNFDNLVIS